ncbi:MAG: (deoxy)nucleoside triphosphate pyrophosphohydrolase [Mycobacterium leprae]
MNNIIPVTAAIIERDGRVLIAQRKPGDTLEQLWEFPGGKLKFGERPEDGIVREIQEELGMAITVTGLFAVESHVYGERHILLLVYRCKPWPGAEATALDVGAFAWVEPGELGRFAFTPADRPIVAKLQGFVTAI